MPPSRRSKFSRLRIIQQKVDKNNCDCIKELTISAHGAGAGNIALGKTAWYYFNKDLLDKADNELGVIQIDQKREMEAATAVFRRIGGYLCSNAKVTFVICYAGEGAQGKVLHDALKSYFPSNTDVVLFPGEAGFLFTIPTATLGFSSKIH